MDEEVLGAFMIISYIEPIKATIWWTY